MPLYRTSLISLKLKAGVNEKVDLWIQSTNLHKDVIKVLAMLKGKSMPIEFGHGFFEGWARTVGVGTHSKLVHTLCRMRFGLQGNNATESGLRYHGDLQNGCLHSLCTVDVEQLF